MLQTIKKLLLEVIDNIDSGNSNITESESVKIIGTIKELTNKEKHLSKYASCQYLNVSRSTFDNYVKDGKLPQGRHTVGFKEKYWLQKDLDDFIKESKKS